MPNCIKAHLQLQISNVLRISDKSVLNCIGVCPCVGVKSKYERLVNALQIMCPNLLVKCKDPLCSGDRNARRRRMGRPASPSHPLLGQVGKVPPCAQSPLWNMHTRSIFMEGTLLASNQRVTYFLIAMFPLFCPGSPCKG